MQIFRTGHDVRAHARNHDGASLREQRARDTKIVRNIIHDFSGNVFFLQRMRSAIVYLHRQLNFGAGDVDLSSSGVATFMTTRNGPLPEKEELERMSASLIRLCTRRHATFDKIFHGESHLPHHIAEIVRDLTDLVSNAYNLPLTEGHEPSSDDLIADMIFHAVNDGLIAMEELIKDIGKDEIGKRQIIDAFYSEIYGNEIDKIAPKIEDKGRRNEYLRNIGLIAKSAGLAMAEEGLGGTFAPKPKALGVNVFHTVVAKSYYGLRSGDVGAKIDEMKPEIRRRIQEEGLLLVAPMAKELGYPDAATFRNELRAVASHYGVAPALSDTVLHLTPPNSLAR